MSANASDIRKFFAGLSIPEGGVRIVGGEKGDAFIAFATDEDARKAMLLDHQSINATPVRLLLSSKSEMQSVTESAQSNAMFAMKQNDCHFDGGAIPQQNQYMNQFSLPQETEIGGQDSHSRVPMDPVNSRDDPRTQWDYPSQNHNAKPPSFPSRENPPPMRDYYDYESNSNYQYRDTYAKMPEPEATRHPYYEHDQQRNFSNYPPQHGQFDDNYRRSDDYSCPDPPMRQSRPPMDPRAQRPHSPPPRNETPNYGYFPPPQESRSPPRNAFKRPHDSEAFEANDYGKRRVEDVPPDERVVRLSVTPKDVSIKSLFEFLKGITIVSKYGVRIEEDYCGRSTGYIYVLTNDEGSYQKILERNGQVFQSRPMIIIPSCLKDFYAVNDPSFLKKCPKSVLQFLPPAHIKFVSPFCRDGCIEMTDLPHDTSDNEIISFLGAPGLEPRDVTIIPQLDGKFVRSVVRLPSGEDLKILLSARPRPFRNNQSLGPIRLVPISLLQYKHMSGESRQRPDMYKPAYSRDDSNRYACTCLHLGGLKKPISVNEFIRSIRSVPLVEDDILVAPDGDMFIDCKTENDCSKVFMELSNPRSFVKKNCSSLRLKRVTRDQFPRAPRGKHGEFGGREGFPPREVMASHHNERMSYSPRREYPPRDYVNPKVEHQRPQMNGERMRPPMGQDMIPRPPMPMDDRGYGWGPRMPRRDMNGKPPGSSVHIHLSNVPTGAVTGRLAEHFRKFNPIFSTIRIYPGARGPAAQIAFTNGRDAEAVIQYVKNVPLDGNYMVARYDRDFHSWYGTPFNYDTYKGIYGSNKE